MVQTQNQTIVQTIIRLWSDPISDPSSLWSDSDETISPADHSDQKHSKSQSSDDKLESIIDHFVAMIMHLLSLCRNKCQLLDFIQIFQRIFQESEEKVELHEERLFITFWRRRVRKSMIAHFALEVASDQTQVRSKRLWSDPSALEEVMISPKCARRGLWSDPIALESASDQTQLRSKSPLIRPKCARIRLWSDFPDQNDLWSDHLQTMIRP